MSEQNNTSHLLGKYKNLKQRGFDDIDQMVHDVLVVEETKPLKMHIEPHDYSRAENERARLRAKRGNKTENKYSDPPEQQRVVDLASTSEDESDTMQPKEEIVTRYTGFDYERLKAMPSKDLTVEQRVVLLTHRNNELELEVQRKDAAREHAISKGYFTNAPSVKEEDEANVEADVEADVETDVEADVESDVESDVEFDVEADAKLEETKTTESTALSEDPVPDTLASYSDVKAPIKHKKSKGLFGKLINFLKGE